MQRLDYRSKSPVRRKWFSTTNLILIGLCVASLAAAAGMAWSRYQASRSALLGTLTGPLPGGVRDGSTPAVWKSYDELHAFYLDKFVKAEGFGPERLISEDDWPRDKMIAVYGKFYSLGTVRMVSLNNGQAPFIYSWGNHNPSEPRLKEAAHLLCDQAQKDGLKELEKGKDVVLTGTGSSRKLLGALRAGTSCMRCHADVKPGALLGALNYPLIAPGMAEERPTDAPGYPKPSGLALDIDEQQ